MKRNTKVESLTVIEGSDAESGKTATDTTEVKCFSETSLSIYKNLLIPWARSQNYIVY